MKKGLCLFLTLMLAAMLLPALAEDGKTETPYIRITVKDYGDLYAELYPDIAPITVENFLKLVNEKFYDGLTFHRIISGFMIQGGDPLGNGTGGSSEQIKGEFSSNGVNNPLSHARGVLSMARSNAPDSASSQFFIMHQDSTYLDGNYAAFGKVLSGLWIVDKICQATPVQDNNGTVLKEDQPIIESIRMATRAEVDGAMAAEAANGASGTVYHDLLSNLSFPVPEGWNKYADAAAQTIFVHAAALNRPIFLLRYNQWDSLSAAYKQYFAEQNMTRQDMDTQAFKKDSLISLTGLDPADFTEETHSGVLFYTGEKTAEDDPAVYYVGAHDAYIYLFAFGGTRADALYGDLTAILDRLAFE
ncbi:MAG: peptidylprolyl isomerase [Clostridia bacterium]|nr:peptidylprolyl isomerase [Clostridia bacterium]